MSPHGFRNWTPREAERFLRDRGFVFEYQEGSHAFFYHAELQAKVCVPEYHHELPPKTLKSIIRQSKISQALWREWAQHH